MLNIYSHRSKTNWILCSNKEWPSKLALFREKIYHPKMLSGGSVMKVITEKCEKCLSCADVCPVKAISKKGEEVVIDKEICLSCGCCTSCCPNDAIEFE